MKQILSYVLDYQRKHFDIKLYLVVFIFLMLSLIVNYHLDFEDSYIDAYHGEWIRWLWMFLFQGLPFLIICVFLSLFGKNNHWYKSKGFWLRFIVGFGLLSAGRAFTPYYLIRDLLPNMETEFISRNVNWVSGLFIVAFPLLIFYHFIEKENPRIYYGLIWKKFDPWPYLVMLGIAGLFLLGGSFMGDLQAYYPRYVHSGPEEFMEFYGWRSWTTLITFEATYGSNFIAVELFFRGFLILALARYLGPYVVLPMAATYCYLHFGKPWGEAFSSIFGGYILGIIALYSRHIWGGIFIHLGVAWLMELLGYIHILLDS